MPSLRISQRQTGGRDKDWSNKRDKQDRKSHHGVDRRVGKRKKLSEKMKAWVAPTAVKAIKKLQGGRLSAAQLAAAKKRAVPALSIDFAPSINRFRRGRTAELKKMKEEKENRGFSTRSRAGRQQRTILLGCSQTSTRMIWTIYSRGSSSS